MIAIKFWFYIGQGHGQLAGFFRRIYQQVIQAQEG
jgi:hypothetical protein